MVTILDPRHPPVYHLEDSPLGTESEVVEFIEKFEQEVNTIFYSNTKLYTPSTLNIDFTLWHTQFLKNLANSRPSASNFKSFSRSLEQFFLSVGQNNFGNKIPFFCSVDKNAIK